MVREYIRDNTNKNQEMVLQAILKLEKPDIGKNIVEMQQECLFSVVT
jgi:hypothetical protein